MRVTARCSPQCSLHVYSDVPGEPELRGTLREAGPRKAVHSCPDKSSLCPFVLNTGFTSKNSDMLDKQHEKCTACQDWYTATYMLVE